MATMKTLNGYGFDSAKLGGRAPEYYTNPRNLLDNSDFRNPVNQRGQTSYIGSDQGSYTIDRWKIWDNETLNVNDGYIEIIGRLYQYYPLNTFKNTVHTFAAKKFDGTIITTTFNPNQEPTQDIYGNLLGSDGWSTVIGLTNGQFVWAALYEGGYTAETLPPYVPKGYAAELAECQRYYYRMNLRDAPCLGSGWAYRSNNRIPITLPMTMRIKPTVQMDVVSNFQIIYNNATYNATNISIQNCTFNHLTLNVVADTGIPDWDIVSSRINNTATIEFSADL